MQNKYSSPKFLLTALGILILLAGLIAAYVLKTQASEHDGMQYRVVGSQSYAIQEDDGKSGADELARFGGTPAVIIASYKQKLRHLFQGDNLAYLVAIVAVILAVFCFRVAWEPPHQD